MELLEVQDLKTYYKTLRGDVKAVDGVTFSVEQAKATGLAGESGCGKTTVATTVLRILPAAGRIAGGKILYKGLDLAKIDEEDMRENYRWKEISIVFQGAMNALNPVYKVSEQISEAITLHEPEVSRREAYERGSKLFELVGIDPARIDHYPHEFSGGMRQRAMIAMALASNPSILIADEPATALDVIVAAQVLKLLRELKTRLNLGMILITHDLSIIAELCENCAIMYAGRIAEYGDVVTIFKDPLHPYTQGLIGAFPSISAKERMRMVSIPGSPPDLLDPPNGCRFHPRCKYAMDVCKRVDPPYVEIDKGHFVACHLVSSIQEDKKS
ncbi:MAG: ABC transporter ATP-binding protein [Candidatus Bathyarchaeia archaeon]|jgi:peptide/nickel transport system ATP-binding protein